MKKKHDPATRKREALNRNFDDLDLPGKFKMIKRQKLTAVAWRLFHRMTVEEQLEFVKTHYRGVKVAWTYQVREGLQFSPRIKLVHLGYSLDVYPQIGNVRFGVTLIRVPTKLTDERTLETIQKYLPTVKVL